MLPIATFNAAGARADLTTAFAALFGVLGALWIGYQILRALIRGKNPFSLSAGKYLEVEVQPAQKIRMRPSDEQARSAVSQTEESDHLLPLGLTDPIPSDYLYLVHTSSLRTEDQAGTLAPCDIRVKLDSYYHGAIDRVSFVEYVLPKASLEPIQRRSDRSNNFELNEIASGEFVLSAKVYLQDEREPLLLQRYITL